MASSIKLTIDFFIIIPEIENFTLSYFSHQAKLPVAYFTERPICFTERSMRFTLAHCPS